MMEAYVYLGYLTLTSCNPLRAFPLAPILVDYPWRLRLHVGYVCCFKKGCDPTDQSCSDRLRTKIGALTPSLLGERSQAQITFVTFDADSSSYSYTRDLEYATLTKKPSAHQSTSGCILNASHGIPARYVHALPRMSCPIVGHLEHLTAPNRLYRRIQAFSRECVYLQKSQALTATIVLLIQTCTF